MTIKFHQHYVTDGTHKARIIYSLDNHVSQRPCVTMYAKDYSDALGRIFRGQYENDTDTMTDYFDKGRVRLFADNPHYPAARKAAEHRTAAQAARWEAKKAKWAAARAASDARA